MNAKIISRPLRPFVILGRKCTLSESRAAPWWLTLDAASVKTASTIIKKYVLVCHLEWGIRQQRSLVGLQIGSPYKTSALEFWPSNYYYDRADRVQGPFCSRPMDLHRVWPNWAGFKALVVEFQGDGSSRREMKGKNGRKMEQIEGKGWWKEKVEERKGLSEKAERVKRRRKAKEKK